MTARPAFTQHGSELFAQLSALANELQAKMPKHPKPVPQPEFVGPPAPPKTHPDPTYEYSDSYSVWRDGRRQGGFL